MTEVKRYTFMCRDGNQLCILELPDIVTGGWVAAADYEAKCADYERLREALEKSENENKRLLSELIKRQRLGWSFCKEMRDAFDQLAMNSEHALSEMEAAGMATHLPTIEEMLGFLNKSDAELDDDIHAAAQRVKNSALTPAAGIPEEADAGVAARKSEESSSRGRK